MVTGYGVDVRMVTAIFNPDADSVFLLKYIYERKVSDGNILYDPKTSSEIELNGKTLKVHKNYQPLLGETIAIITPKEYAEICDIHELPSIYKTNLDSCTNEILPYIIQKIKMWGCDALTASSISRLLLKEPKMPSSTTVKSKKGPSFGKTLGLNLGKELDKTAITPSNASKRNKNPLNRFDCIVRILSSAECTVSQDILRIMAKFPMALPLIMPDIEQENEFKVMLPLLTSPVIKREVKYSVVNSSVIKQEVKSSVAKSPVIKQEVKYNEINEIFENHLFLSPFKLLVALRLGTNIPSGKSTILNQLMATEHMFSSSSDPGASRGQPYTLSGSVEFVWLTQETCNDSLWKSVMEPYYRSIKTEEIVLLANLHGDALEYKEHIKWLDQIASRFLVFIMPNAGEQEWIELSDILDPEKLVHLLVDPQYSVEDEFIETRNLTNDDTLEIVRAKFKDALESNIFDIDISKIMCEKPLKLAENVYCDESRRIVNFIKKKSCYRIKKIIKNRNRPRVGDEIKNTANKDRDKRLLKELMKNFESILMLPLGERRKAMAHLERGLSEVSEKESSAVRKDLLRSKGDLIREMDLIKGDKDKIKTLRDQVNAFLEKVDDVSLGLEHFFRELGKFYEISLDNQYNPALRLPKSCAELFVDNHAIELIDGDADEMQSVWLSAIFKEIDALFPNLRIFVVSILGLQSSGKSTLLNALFACRFAVSVGRCTRGLFMRLLFLDKKLRDKNNVDAILLIDTEGLGAPEKMNDKYATQKDRRLSTYVMGISNLTFINHMGESMNELTEILQIAIVAMARLEENNIAPDIFMIQHLTESNTGKSFSGQTQFYRRIQNGDFIKQFRPLKNGSSSYAPPSEQYHEDVVNLYKDILDACGRPITFNKWYTLAKGYWECVKNENFATQFKNISEMYNFMELSKNIEEVKEAVNSDFRAHAKKCEDDIRNEFLFLSQQNGSNRMQAIEHNVREGCKVKIINQLKVAMNDEICKECQNAINRINQFKEYLQENEYLEDKTREILDTIKEHIDSTRKGTEAHLTQIIDAKIIETGCNTEFMDEITTSLEIKLKERPSGKYNDKECRKFFEEIWKNLEKIATDKNNIPPVEDRILNEVENAYGNLSTVRDQFRNFITNNNIDQRSTNNTFSDNVKGFFFNIFSNKVQKQKEIEGILKEELNELTDKIMEMKGTGYFESGMINKLKIRVDTLIKGFQVQHALFKNGDDKTKWHLHVETLKIFYNKIVIAQHKWDEKNNPLKILQKRKSDYETFIIGRLQKDFSAVSDGIFVANCLLKKIMIMAAEKANSERKSRILKFNWIKDVTHLRYNYFKQLAMRVKENKALDHFSNPKDSIESWFSEIVNESHCDVLQEIYEKTFKEKFQEIKQKIETNSEFPENLDVIKSYLDEADIMAFNMIEEATDKNIKVFQKSILKTLDDVKEKYDFKNINFCNPSEDDDIMKKLGCTYSCFWCGALCWGPRGHKNNIDETKMHSTCHQPQGLTGTHIIGTKELKSWPCHLIDDNVGFRWGGREDFVKWGVTKREHFPEWKFSEHHNTTLNKLMCWFFQELNEKIAQSKGLAPASISELQKYRCDGLEYSRIMNELYSIFE
ncbi:15534_t:CDS:2 [Acaulospora morrowiae]|uniref:15534_t:CDS:1 n=1 Tax=Acaulospora morrowiae TaxID=94023 RepID=A0A9N8YU85_9GLOM|nr:15534_t:CDS:2 [Acaulospora morrowiae]